MIANEKAAPVALDKRFFDLSTAKDEGSFPALTPPYTIQLDPGQTLPQLLSIAVAADVDPRKLKLCSHAPESGNWNDYLEIPFSYQRSSTAPMWHPARVGETPR